MEEISKSRRRPWHHHVVVNNSLVCHGLLHFGTDAQKQKYLPFP